MPVSEKLIKRLKAAFHVVVASGAGISAASGVPTFRGKDGLWNKFKPQDLANMNAFLEDPALVWEWYRWRRNIIKNVKPNAGHYALVEMEQYFPEFSVITQNVDNLHQSAGTKNITELHGNIMRDKCINCTYECDETETNAAQFENNVPRCPQCGSLLRPGVVWFGEMLPQTAIARGQSLAAEAEIFFSIGTSSLVEPAASLPYIAKGNGALLVEINPEETPLSSIVDQRFASEADEILPKLAMLVRKVRKRIENH